MHDTLRTFKAQSAMEYLMTYGWAILIMAVVLAALFALGVFSGASLTGSSCIATSGYLCSNPSLSAAGTLSFGFGQNSGQNIYNIQMACTSTANVVTGSASIASLPWQPIAANGIAYTLLNTANAVNSLSVLNTGQFAISNLYCYAPGGASANTLPLGTQFTGYIWLNYSTTICKKAPCTWLTARVATINLKVV